jgi:hypothetical protein
MDYAEAVYKYYYAHRLNIHELMFFVPQFIYHMQLDRKLEEEKEYTSNVVYNYDSLNRITWVYYAGSKTFYMYNDKNQRTEMSRPNESKPLVVKYEYDANGLLIREVMWLTKEDRIYSEQVYEYAACK